MPVATLVMVPISRGLQLRRECLLPGRWPQRFRRRILEGLWHGFRFELYFSRRLRLALTSEASPCLHLWSWSPVLNRFCALATRTFIGASGDSL
jgi:hypothetical protein